MADRGALEALQQHGIRGLLQRGRERQPGPASALVAFRKWLFAFSALALLAGWAYAAAYAIADRRLTLESASKQLISIDAALDVHTEAILADGLGAAEAAANHLGSFADARVEAALARNLPVLRRELTGGEYVSALFIGSSTSILITDRSGYEYASAQPPAWLRMAFDTAPRIFIGSPIAHPRYPDQRVVPIAKRIAGEGADAVYAGAWFSVEALHRRYARLLPNDGVMGLVGSDGRILARIASGTIQQSPMPTVEHARAALRRDLPVVREQPAVITRPSYGGMIMLYAFSRPMAEADLVTVVGRSRDSVLQPWRTRMWTVLGVVTTATVLLLAMTGLLHHYVEQLNRAKSALEEANETLEQRVEERTLELQQANVRLAAANEELEAFSAAASHDLRSPLTTISGQAGLLELRLDGEAGQEVRERLERIQSAVRRAVEVIDGMLSLARISRHELEREEVSLSALVRQAIDEVRESDPQRVVQARVEEDVRVMADSRLMKSLMSNLVSNAWKYSAGKERVEIEFRCEPDPAGPVYCITDRGAGFDMAHAAHLFHPFRRLHSVKDFPGTGVGLAIVARIVHRYGGRAWARGEVGKGATFCFTLPLAQAGVPPARHTSGSAQGSSGGSSPSAQSVPLSS